MNAIAFTITPRPVAHMIVVARARLATARDLLHLPTPNARAARAHILVARALWAAVRRAVALGDATLRHCYTPAANGWYAIIKVGDAVLWMGAHVYAHRQSAQRAALRVMDRITRDCENTLLA